MDKEVEGKHTNNEKTGKGNHDITRRVGDTELQVTNRSPDHETDEHPNTTQNKRVTTTHVLDNVQTREGHTEVDSTEDDLGDVAVQTNGREDTVTEVEDEVGTGELLQRLQHDTQDGTVEHARAGEDLVPRGLAGFVLLFELVLHVLHLLRDAAVVRGHTVQLAHDLAGFLEAAVAVGVAGRLGQEQGTDTQDERPGKANTHGDTPRSSRVDGVRAVVDNVRDEDTKRNEQLEGTDHGTTDLPGRRLGLVHGHDGRQSADTQTGNETAHGDLVPLGVCGDLDDDADHVDDGPEGDGELAADAVCDGGGDEGANHGTNGELLMLALIHWCHWGR